MMAAGEHLYAAELWRAPAVSAEGAHLLWAGIWGSPQDKSRAPPACAGTPRRFWQALAASFAAHRKRWVLGGIVAALLLLLIVLLATLVPKRGGGPDPPRFLATPAVSATGASFFDVTVQLDQAAVLSWAAFRTSDLQQQVRRADWLARDLGFCHIAEKRQGPGGAQVQAGLMFNCIEECAVHVSARRSQAPGARCSSSFRTKRSLQRPSLTRPPCQPPARAAAASLGCSSWQRHAAGRQS